NVLDAYDDASYAAQTKNSSFHSTYDDYSAGGSLRLDAAPAERHRLSALAQYKADTHREQDTAGAAWESYQAESYSLALEDSFRTAIGLELAAGAGYEIQRPRYAAGNALRPAQTALDPRLAAGYGLPDGTKLRLAAAVKTRFPALKELFSGYLDRNLPNPDLRRERAVNYELGASRSDLPGGLAADASAFYSDLTDLIVSRPAAAGKQQNQNVGKARYMGGELRLESPREEPVSIDFSYAYLDARDLSPNRTSARLPDRPAHAVHAGGLGRLGRRLSLRADARWYSGRHYQDPDTLAWGVLADYWTTDVKLTWAAAAGLSADVGVRNVFDRNYETAYGYPRAGRAAFAGLRYEF
ncbi:MAG: TonB-dependent receptor, partial [Elusimicrobia bacterium]|nr:TonB-dependent receptor [Elusimicrobiota bacterium]